VKILLVIHHFPPDYTAGAEQYAYRIAQGLRRQGHAIEVVCIKSITEGTLIPSCTTDVHDGLTVHRLRFDLRQAPNPFEWSFRNPQLGYWLGLFLQRNRPDVVHVNSGYLLGGTVIEAALACHVPTVLTLHDYWFMCPLITLLRTDETICEGPAHPADCTWCLFSQHRCHHLANKWLCRRLRNAFVRLNRPQAIAKAIGTAPQLELIAERRRYLKQVLESVDAVVSPSRFLMRKVDEHDLHPRRTVYLPFGLDPAYFSNPRPSGTLAPLRIGYMGQFAPHKGVHLLLAAFKKIARHSPSCRLILHGQISTATLYERGLLHEAGHDPAITFAGPYPNEQVGQVLNGLDVVVVPSIWYENRPTVIVEAHAARVPVVAARLGGMAELVRHDKNGLLFEPGDVESLAGQLQRLLTEPALLSQLRSGIQPVPAIEDETATLLSLYESLL
jgi:glycosyltransferase involved in cell wall biosynthesis